MRYKVKGQKWVAPSEGPIAIELTTGEKAEVAAAPPHQTRFVFGDQPLAGWVTEENPVEEKEPPKEKEPVSAASATVPPVKKKEPPKKKAPKGKGK